MGFYIGIDPGKSGALAIQHENGHVETYVFDETAYRDALARIDGETAKCCVEKVGSMPKQGVAGMFTFGKNAGFIEGLLVAYKIPYQLVPPQTWKKEFCLNSDKQKSIEVCKRLFPNVNLFRTDKCKKEHDGIAEAVLMAEYARRKL